MTSESAIYTHSVHQRGVADNLLDSGSLAATRKWGNLRDIHIVRDTGTSSYTEENVSAESTELVEEDEHFRLVEIISCLLSLASDNRSWYH